MSEKDRDRGILTPADRAYLRGESSFGSVQAERNARARIRDRAFDALLDFETLVEGLSERDRALLFERVDEAGTRGFDALVAAAAFLYLGVEETGIEFETVLEEGINVAEATRDRSAAVDLTVTPRELGPAALAERLRAGESLSLTEIALLRESDAVGDAELERYLADDDRPGADVADDGRVQSTVTSFD